jgi:chromate transporter
VHSEIVERRGWLSEEKFFASLTFAQVLPGPGPVNSAIYIGLQIAGWVGALAAVIGMILPAFCIILCLGALYGRFGSIEAVQTVLGGLAAVGIGVTASMGLRRLLHLRRDIPALFFATVVFVLVGIFQWSIPSIVVFVLPPSLVVAYLQDRRRTDG